jgi:beta-glucanase (GH16 family)
MKKILAILLLTSLTISCKKTEDKPATTTTTDYNPGAGWTQSWSEEFNGSSLNTSFWNYETGGGGWGNSELQYYRQENVNVANGNLVITAKKENYSTNSFTSGRITSQGKYSFKYGKIVGRIKLPQGYGIWPAFWMLGTSAQAWPACGEIDIMEMQGGQGSKGDQTTYSTYHWQNSSYSHDYYGQPYIYPAKLSQDYHYYEVEWNATSVISRFDGVQFNQMNLTSSEVSELRDNYYYIILNLAVGGNFFYPALTNEADVTAVFPQKMYVDWIRIYQK